LRKRNGFLALLAVVLSFSLVFTGCAKKTEENKTGENKTPQVIKYVLGADPQTLDPGKMTGAPEGTIANEVFEGLTRYDKDGKIAPGIAESWEISDDGKTYTFHLRDAKWSDGTPVTANDFKYAWLRALSPELASQYAYQLFYIKGAEAYNSGKGKAEDVAITVVDDKTLKVELTEPAPQFLGLTAFQTLMPLKKEAVDANPDFKVEGDKKIVGNGPFVIESYKSKDKIVLKKNPNYWDAASVKLDELDFYLIDDAKTALTMFENGEVDMISDIPTEDMPRLKQEGKLKVFPQLATYFYRFNTTKKPFNDPRVRKAFAMAIERQAIIDTILQAEQKPAYAFVPYGILDANGKDFRENGGNAFFKEDIAEAKKLLAEAGYPDGKGFPTVTILFNTSEGHKKIAEAIQQMWKKNLGVNVQILNQEWQVYLDSQSKLKYDVCRAGWIADYSDPMTFIDMFVTNGGNNETGWSNKKYDELVKKAKSTNDQAVRMQAMHEAEKILMDEMPIAPIYFYTNPELISDKIQDVVVPSFGVEAEFKWASVK